MKQKSEILETQLFSRSFDLQRDQISEETRTVEIAFSSEMPVERNFGSEILDHKPESVRLGRLNNSGPVLVNHNLDDQVGVIESARIDSDKVGRASIRFGKSDRASEIFQDVQDGIRTQVSVGYAIHKMEMEKENPPKYRVVDFEPYEVSIVSSGADQSVGIGRDSENIFQTEVLKIDSMERKQMEVTEVEAPKVDTAKIREQVQKEERARVQEIEAYGREHKETQLADEYIREGKSSGEFAMAVLKRIQERPEDVKNIGLTKPEINQFSFMRLINHLAKPGDRQLEKEASFEIDVCLNTEKASGKASRGYMIPNDVLYEKNLKMPGMQKRELLAGSGDGQYLVPTILDSASFIEFLDAQMVSVQMGARTLRNLDGIIKIPRRDSAISGGWIAESADAGDVTPSYDQLTLQLHTYALRVDVSRQLRLQSGSLDVENLLRTDIASSIAVAFDKASLQGKGEGDEPNSPVGICNTANVGITTITADQFSWANAMAMQGDVMSANAYFGSLGYVLHPTLASDAKARTRDSGSGRFVMEGNDIGGFRAMVTPSAIFGSKERAIFGNWNDLILAYFSNGIDIQVNREFDDGRIRLVCFLDADVGVRHAGSFAITNDA
jgi:HK97 family phage major capsid protein/HK97 family phage prohead protease